MRLMQHAAGQWLLMCTDLLQYLDAARLSQSTSNPCNLPFGQASHALTIEPLAAFGTQPSRWEGIPSRHTLAHFGNRRRRSRSRLTSHKSTFAAYAHSVASPLLEREDPTGLGEVA